MGGVCVEGKDGSREEIFQANSCESIKCDKNKVRLKIGSSSSRDN